MRDPSDALDQLEKDLGEAYRGSTDRGRAVLAKREAAAPRSPSAVPSTPPPAPDGPPIKPIGTATFNVGAAPPTPTRKERGLEHGKADFSTLSPAFLAELSVCQMLGNHKYGEFNWLNGGSIREFAAASIRHMEKLLAGEDLDSKDGIHHVVHASLCNMYILEWWASGTAIDDRAKGLRNVEDHIANLLNRIKIPEPYTGD